MTGQFLHADDWTLTPAMSQYEVAEKLGVTRSCIEKTEKVALRKLRAALLKEYGDDAFETSKGAS
jgi:hypothetical protein